MSAAGVRGKGRCRRIEAHRGVAVAAVQAGPDSDVEELSNELEDGELLQDILAGYNSVRRSSCACR